VETDDAAEIPVLEAIRQGDAYAMTEFVHRNARWVRSVIFGVLGRSVDVDDVAQRVWLKVWREAGRLQDLVCWRGWLYRIARNAAMDVGRGRRRRREAIDHAAEQARRSPPVATPEQQLSAVERERAVLEAIETLSAIYREPFVLKHVEGLSYRQIGELLGLPPDTVETRLVRARRRLREELAGRM